MEKAAEVAAATFSTLTSRSLICEHINTCSCLRPSAAVDRRRPVMMSAVDYLWTADEVESDLERFRTVALPDMARELLRNGDTFNSLVIGFGRVNSPYAKADFLVEVIDELRKNGVPNEISRYVEDRREG